MISNHLSLGEHHRPQTDAISEQVAHFLQSCSTPPAPGTRSRSPHEANQQSDTPAPTIDRARDNTYPEPINLGVPQPVTWLQV
jgi:hypothetical protein